MQRLSRREYLASGAILATIVTGCLGTDGPPNARSGIDTPDFVTHVEFDWQDAHERTPRPDAITPGSPPEFDTTTDAVHVEGWITYGSSTCDEPYLAAVDTNEEHETLVLTVDQRERPDLDRNSCADDLATAAYSITVSFEEPPETIEVVEEHHPNGPSTTTGSVTL